MYQLLFCEIKNAVPCESLVVLSGSDEVLTDIVVLTESETVNEMVPSLHVSQLLFQKNQLQSKRIICTMQPLYNSQQSEQPKLTIIGRWLLYRGFNSQAFQLTSDE